MKPLVDAASPDSQAGMTILSPCSIRTLSTPGSWTMEMPKPAERNFKACVRSSRNAPPPNSGWIAYSCSKAVTSAGIC